MKNNIDAHLILKIGNELSKIIQKHDPKFEYVKECLAAVESLLVSMIYQMYRIGEDKGVGITDIDLLKESILRQNEMLRVIHENFGDK